MKLTDAARSKVENAEKPSYFHRMGPMGQEFGINGKIVSQKEYCAALKPWQLPPLCYKTVVEKLTQRVLGVVLGSAEKDEGKYTTIGEVGFIIVDPNIHTTHLTTANEMKCVHKRGFYDAVQDVPAVSIGRFHKP